jgi:hypothetical protein
VIETAPRGPRGSGRTWSWNRGAELPKGRARRDKGVRFDTAPTVSPLVGFRKHLGVNQDTNVFAYRWMAHFELGSQLRY